MNIVDATRLQCYFETLLCIAPYWRHGHRLVYRAWINIWTICGLALFVSFVILSATRARTENYMQFRFSKGYLWGIIATFEFAFTNVAYPALVVHQLFNRHYPVHFYNGIAELDEQLEQELGVPCSTLNRHLRKLQIIGMAIAFTYFNTLWVAMLLVLVSMHLEMGMGTLMFVMANQMEQFAMCLLTMSISSQVLILGQRFRALRRVRLPEWRTKEATTKEVLQNTRRRIAVYLGAFKRLVGMIDALSCNMGNVMMLRFTHDFTLLLSQLYLVWWLISENGPSNWLLIMFVVYWSVLNVVKITVVTVVAHYTIQEAYLTSAIICAQNDTESDLVVKQMLDSFALWLLHRKIRFTANNFFTVDLTLVYAVVGALASYLLILIQFKQQEESLSATKAAATAAATAAAQTAMATVSTMVPW